MIELTAPAKINLTLEVLGRREDGYHTIASIMHTLSLHDTLTLTPIGTTPGQISIEVEGFAVPTDERNLVWRALELIGVVSASSLPKKASLSKKDFVASASRRRFFGSAGASPSTRSLGVPTDEDFTASASPPTKNLVALASPPTSRPRNADATLSASSPTKASGWHVRLIKRIPTEAGLGGGSSDAAAILKRFCPSPQIALSLGSDVPFFLNGACARVDGRGEQVKPLPPLPPFWWVLAKPKGVGVSTAWAYAQLNRSKDDSRPTSQPCLTDRLEQAIRQGAIRTPDDLVPLLHNDFEAVVLPAFEPLRRLRAQMESLGALRVLLCGSGAAQAALCPSRNEAEQMANTLRSEGYWAAAAQLGL